MVNADIFLSHFSVAGINYRKSDVNIRGQYSISTDQSRKLLEDAAHKLSGCFILSTCNRTEVYGICNHPDELIDLLCTNTGESRERFMEYGYVKQGLVAVEHLFKVTAGLDSQIIGDYEILSQVKKSALMAKQAKCLNGFMEKVINFALQASKEIKSTTRLSSGTVSVSYATIEIIREKITSLAGKKILVVGMGKLGHQAGKNIKTYLPECFLYFCNRTDLKAENLAKNCTADFIPYDHLPVIADMADIIVVSSSANGFTILPSFFSQQKSRLILDLSVPQNVDPMVKNIEGIELLNVDEISTLLNNTLSLRSAEIPKADLIINDTLQQLLDWSKLQANNKLLSTVKSQLFSLSGMQNQDSFKRAIHKTVSTLAIELKLQNNKGCQCIHAINSYLQNNYDKAC